jgi:hypothetical protein
VHGDADAERPDADVVRGRVPRGYQSERHVYTESMADQAGNVLSSSDPEMPPGHPLTTEVRVELENLVVAR